MGDTPLAALLAGLLCEKGLEREVVEFGVGA